MDQSTAILIVGSWATLGWYFTNRQNIVLARRRHTYDLFQAYRLNEEHVKAIDHFKILVREKRVPQAFSESGIEEDNKIVMYLW